MGLNTREAAETTQVNTIRALVRELETKAEARADDKSRQLLSAYLRTSLLHA